MAIERKAVFADVLYDLMQRAKNKIFIMKDHIYVISPNGEQINVYANPLHNVYAYEEKYNAGEFHLFIHIFDSNYTLEESYTIYREADMKAGKKEYLYHVNSFINIEGMYINKNTRLYESEVRSYRFEGPIEEFVNQIYPNGWILLMFDQMNVGIGQAYCLSDMIITRIQ